MTRDDAISLAEGLERAASVTWRSARDDDASWDRAKSLMMAQRYSLAAIEVRALIDEGKFDRQITDIVDSALVGK